MPEPSTSVDAMLARLASDLPLWRIYSMGEHPEGGAYDPFFCGLVSRAGGRAEMGHGGTLAAAIATAVTLVEASDAARDFARQGGAV